MGFFRRSDGSNGDMAFTSYTATGLATEIKAFRPAKSPGRLWLSWKQPNPINAVSFRRCLQNNKALMLYDCKGKRVNQGQIDIQGTFVVKNKATSATQRVFVVK
jgi:hypothetical protein